MLSPDVPEFVPRGFQTSNAVNAARGSSKAPRYAARGFQASHAIAGARGDSRAVKRVSQQKWKQAPLESRSRQSLSSQPTDICHNHLSSQRFSWGNVTRNMSPVDREGKGKPEFKRYGNTVKGISNVSQSEGNSRNPPQSAVNLRDSWRLKDSSVDKTTKSNDGIRKFNSCTSSSRDWFGKYHKGKHVPERGRGRSQTGSYHAPNENNTNSKVITNVQKKEHRGQMPTTVIRYRESLSYGNIVRSNGSNDNSEKSEPKTAPEMSLLLDDQWPSLSDTHSQAMPWVKRKVESNSLQNVTNAWTVEKKVVAVKERNHSKENLWHIKDCNRTTDEKVAHKVDRVDENDGKLIRNCRKYKDIVKEIGSEECYGKENRGFGKNKTVKVLHGEFGRTKAKQDRNEQNLSLNGSSQYEKQDLSSRKVTQEGVDTVQEQNQNGKPYSETREDDPFQWQLKTDKKRRTKAKQSLDQQDKLDKPVDVFSKDGRKKDKILTPDNSFRKMSKEGYRKYKKDDASSSLELNTSISDKFWIKKEKREKKELVRKSEIKADRIFKEETSRTESQLEPEIVQNSLHGTVSTPVEQHDANEIPASADGVETSVSEHQKRILDVETSQRLKVIKRRQKEEKMRKREEKLLKARELKKRDSKVTIITRDFLESTLFGSTKSRKANSSIPNSRKLKLFSEEYPSLVRGGRVASRIELDDVFETTLEESDEDVSATDEPEVDSDLSVSKSSGALETVSHKPSESVPTAGVPSYSKALLAAKREVDEKSTPEKVSEDVPEEVEVQRKKVRANDLIELDLMAAALLSRKTKKKDLTKNKEATTALKASKKKTTEGSPGHSPSKNTKDSTAPSVQTKMKEVTIVKRGKQREGQKKKKISHLKKCMQRARQLELETLLSILREAKNAQEKSKSSCIQEIKTTPNLPEAEAIVTESSLSEKNKELMTLSTSLDVPSDKVLCINEDNIIKNVDLKCDMDSNDMQEVNDLKNVPDELTHSEVNNHMSNSVSVSVTELTTETSDEKCKPEANGKDNTEVTLEEDSNHKGKESIDILLEPVCDDMNLKMPPETLNIDSENKTELDSGTLDPGKLALEESVTQLHDKPETPKKFLGFIQELKDLQNPIHKKKFREYCNHLITPEVDSVTKELVETLVNFQSRHFQRDPTKARIRRRYVCGLKETTKLMGKMSCIIVAPDIQRSKGPGALDEVVEKMLEHARIHGVPVIFALTCKYLGKLCFKKVPVSCFGIISYQGAQDKFQTLMKLVPEAQKQYQELIAQGSRSLPVDDEELINKEREPEKLDINKEVIAKTLAKISGIAEE